MADFEYARDKVLMGAKREEVLTGKEKSMTAYHEAGHALLAWLVPGTDRVHKVSIIPRGRALGVTQLLPEEDRVNISESELHTRLLFLLGGRAAEKLVFDEYSAGAEDDLKQATQLARRMVTHWGMSERLGPVAFRDGEEHPFLGKEMAEPRAVQRAHGAGDRRRGRPHPPRRRWRRPRASWTSTATSSIACSHELEQEETLDERQIDDLIGPSAYEPSSKLTLSGKSAEAIPPAAASTGDGAASNGEKEKQGEEAKTEN